MRLLSYRRAGQDVLDCGDYQVCERLLNRIIEIKERDLGRSSSDLIDDLFELSLLYEAQGNRTDAFKNAKRAYEIACLNRSFDKVDLRSLKESIKRNYAMPVLDWLR